MAIAVPTFTRLVRAAMANDRCSGEPKYSSEYLCSVVSACEKPSRSAASACSRISPSTACGSPVTRPWVNSTPTDMGAPHSSPGVVPDTASAAKRRQDPNDARAAPGRAPSGVASVVRSSTPQRDRGTPMETITLDGYADVREAFRSHDLEQAL